MPLRQLEIFEGALVRGLAYSYEIQEYVGCPNCKTKFRDNTGDGRPAECNDRDIKGGGKKKGCGLVTAKKMAFTTLVIVDQRFDVKLKFSPDTTIPESKLKEIVDGLKPVWAIGSLQKNDTFRVDWYELEENLLGVTPIYSGPNGGSTTGTGLSSGTTTTTVPTVPTPTTVPSQTTTTVPSTVSAPSLVTNPLPATEIQRMIDEEFMEYMNVFQGTATVDAIIDFFKRRNVGEEHAKNILLEAIMQKKVVKDGNTVRKVAR